MGEGDQGGMGGGGGGGGGGEVEAGVSELFKCPAFMCWQLSHSGKTDYTLGLTFTTLLLLLLLLLPAWLPASLLSIHPPPCHPRRDPSGRPLCLIAFSLKRWRPRRGLVDQCECVSTQEKSNQVEWRPAADPVGGGDPGPSFIRILWESGRDGASVEHPWSIRGASVEDRCGRTHSVIG